MKEHILQNSSAHSPKKPIEERRNMAPESGKERLTPAPVIPKASSNHNSVGSHSDSGSGGKEGRRGLAVDEHVVRIRADVKEEVEEAKEGEMEVETGGHERKKGKVDEEEEDKEVDEEEEDDESEFKHPKDGDQGRKRGR